MEVNCVRSSRKGTNGRNRFALEHSVRTERTKSERSLASISTGGLTTFNSEVCYVLK